MVEVIDQVNHAPVLIEEVLEYLNPTVGSVIIDGTFGRGGYSKRILESAENVTVVGVDRDQEALAAAKKMAVDYAGRLQPVHGRFSQLDKLAQSLGHEKVDGVVLDLGVSSPQLDVAERGFSFMRDGPLDMRMDEREDCDTAADIVNTWDEQDLADLFYQFGEEKQSRRVARAIVKEREEQNFLSTLQLADCIERAIPAAKKKGHHPATKTFQALRIAVNQELDEVRGALEAAKRILKHGGRLVVVSFHSLEDRIVKEFLKENVEQTGGGGSRHLPFVQNDQEVSFSLLTRKPVVPSPEEEARNPRARSSKLRAARRVLSIEGEGL